MNSRDVRSKIKQRGHWIIQISPLSFNKMLIPSRDKAKKIIQESAVQFRGWDYPHMPANSDDHESMFLGADYVEAFIDWNYAKEYWRFYQSGLFYNEFGIFEDWYDEDSLAGDQYKSIKPGELLNVTGTVYRVAEIFQFFKKLAEHEIFESGAVASIIINGVNGRHLQSLDPGRLPIMFDYSAHVDKIEYKPPELPKDQLIGDANELALGAVDYIFETFNWERRSLGTFKNDIDDLLNRRF